MPYRLPKKQIIKNTNTIGNVLKTGKKIITPTLSIHFLFVPKTETITNKECVQVAFLCSKKLFKNATDRNRIKRLMRESFRLHQHHINALKILQTHYLQLVFLYKNTKIETFINIEKYTVLAFNKLLVSQQFFKTLKES